jgi:uncharacterized ferredoxin-like protein
MITTIQIENSIKDRLDHLKVHHRETYNELIARLIANASPKNASNESLIETIETLSDPEEMREIAEALESFKRGEGVSFEKLKKDLKLNV